MTVSPKPSNMTTTSETLYPLTDTCESMSVTVDQLIESLS
jgi:hypothetical protein